MKNKINFTDTYNKQILNERMMGPNAMRVSEEMTNYLDISSSHKILDLGAGMGLSTALLAKKYNPSIVSADLWISPTDNHEFFKQEKIDTKILPMSIDATKDIPLPFYYFDMIFSVDSYHYFGNNEAMLPKLISYVKKGGYIAVAVPGLKKDFKDDIYPDELQPFWQPNMNFHSVNWWNNLWQQEENEGSIKIEIAREMDCMDKAWSEWLSTSNEHAISDRDMMKAEDGKYFSLVMIIAKVLK